MEKIRIRLKSFDHRLLDQSVKDIVIKAKRTGASISGPIPLPTNIHKFCVLRSPHVDKRSREHFEMRIYKRLMDISNYNNETIDELQKLDLPAGIDVEIQAFGSGGE
jgi:small subunit ribosomal protein S10